MAFPKTHIFSQLRREYAGGQLLESDADADAIAQFGKWFDQAVNDNVPHANAFTLATVDDSGQPSGRVLLLKDFDQRGFVFVTNYASRKGKELLANPKAGMVFFWEPLERQVRIEGVVEKTSAEESATHYHERPREAQIAAYTSHQSEVIASRQALEERHRAKTIEFGVKPIPTPPFWGAYRLVPNAIEFWQGRPGRLHDRLLYAKQAGGSWKVSRLAP